MDRILIKAVGIVFQGVVQTLIDATVRAEAAEQQVQILRQQLAARQGRESNVSRLPTTAEAGG